ncbi:hypothetical protein ES703_04807 [subsurface metagenome]
MKCKVFSIRLLDSFVESDISVFNDFLETVKVSRIFSSIVNSDTSFWSVLVFYEGKSTLHTVPAEDITLTDSEERVYEALRNWRNDQAKKENVQPYMIAHNLWFKQMVRMRIKDKEDLLQIKGFGEKRIAKYGEDIVKLFASLDQMLRTS